MNAISFSNPQLTFTGIAARCEISLTATSFLYSKVLEAEQERFCEESLHRDGCFWRLESCCGNVLEQCVSVPAWKLRG